LLTIRQADVETEVVLRDEGVEVGAEIFPGVGGDFELDADQVAVRGFGLIGSELFVRGEEQVAEGHVVETGEGDVEIGCLLKFADDVDEFDRVPIATDELVVEGDVEGLFFFQRQLDHNDVDFGDALLLEDLQSLMAGDDVAGGPVPDKGLDEIELAEGAFQATIAGRTGLQGLARVVGSGVEVGEGEALNLHGIPLPGWY
jgi:hypothetical protein